MGQGVKNLISPPRNPRLYGIHGAEVVENPLEKVIGAEAKDTIRGGLVNVIEPTPRPSLFPDPPIFRQQGIAIHVVRHITVDQI